MLTGTALRTEATRLNIPGRSKMSADQLRAAIDAVTTPVPPQPTPSPIVQVTPVTPVPFRARNGKRKRSTIRQTHHRRNR